MHSEEGQFWKANEVGRDNLVEIFDEVANGASHSPPDLVLQRCTATFADLELPASLVAALTNHTSVLVLFCGRLCAPIVRSSKFKKIIDGVLWANVLVLCVGYQGRSPTMAMLDETLGAVFTVSLGETPT